MGLRQVSLRGTDACDASQVDRLEYTSTRQGLSRAKEAGLTHLHWEWKSLPVQKGASLPRQVLLQLLLRLDLTGFAFGKVMPTEGGFS